MIKSCYLSFAIHSGDLVPFLYKPRDTGARVESKDAAEQLKIRQREEDEDKLRNEQMEEDAKKG